MPLELYQQKNFSGRRSVLINRSGFRFSVAARDVAQLAQINWMRLYTNSEERQIVFVPVQSVEKSPDLLKLGTSKKGHKSLSAKGLIRGTPWVLAVAKQTHTEARKFELRRYDGALPPLRSGVRGRQPWYIQLMPAFDKSVAPNDIHELDDVITGIYRYYKGDQVIYIGKGQIRERYRELGREAWEVSRIEYSEIADDAEALKWEAFWIDRFQREHNGNLPRHNQVRGHRY